MTERLYYKDAYLVDFTAQVTAIEADGTHIVLDRTAFYPTSGGQPHDIGALGTSRIIDVIDEETRVVHVCAAPTSLAIGERVSGLVDQERRFDHMQQHSGQHLLSALLADAYGWSTVSVHFGDDTNTVDVTAASIDLSQLLAIESRVNRLAADDRDITVTFEDAAHATGLRKPSNRDGMLRIVSIVGIDKSACGGTHVRRTGEIGSILLRRVEKTKGHTRIEFVCGLRAVARARADAALLTTTSRLLTAAPDDIPSLVELQQRRIADLERERKQFTAELAKHSAQSYWNAAFPDATGVRRVMIAAFEDPVRDAEPLVQALTALGPCIALVLSPSSCGVMLGASDGSGVDAGPTLRAALQAHGGRGGGSPRLAQGSVPNAEALLHIATVLGFAL